MVTPHGRVDPSERGFSVAELMIGLLISSLTMAAAITMTDQVSRSYTSQLDDAVIQEEARYALQWIEGSLRSAGSNPYGILTTDCPIPGTLVQAVQRDPDADGVMDDIRIMRDTNPPNGQFGGVPCGSDAAEDITIAFDPVNRVITRLDNSLGGAPVSMSDSVIAGLQFTYLDLNRAPAATDAATTYVQIAVTAQAPNRDRNTGLRTSYTLRSEVRVRVR
jgi:hypothetical protein